MNYIWNNQRLPYAQSGQWGLFRVWPLVRISAFLVRPITFGLDKQDVFFGIPPIQSILFPIALPELTLYRNVRNRGYTRLSIDTTDTTTGRLISRPSVVEASVIFQRYTVLFLFSWQSTDLVPPPL